MNAISRWLSDSTDDLPKESRVAKRHAGLVEMNATVTEYAALLESVSAERADLLKQMSELQFQNAELSVSKSLFVDLEEELRDIRETAQKSTTAVKENRALAREIEHTREDNADLKKRNTSLSTRLDAALKKVERLTTVDAAAKK